ncbi:MAG: hypothetical protein WCA44_16245 [Acidobacteriaceae bacterium]|jgi:hypothetical protein
MSFILLTAAVVHVPLLLMELPLNSYDANLHIFFASHYLHHWFNPWNAKWFAGFSQTTYPPLAQQWIAIFAHGIGLEMAYMLVQFLAIVVLAYGMYRYATIWVGERAASFAALGVVLLGSESFLIYNAGQLGTTWEAALYVLALPYLYEWLRYGGFRPFLKAVVLFATACAAHDVIVIFGTVFFTVPLIALALMERNKGEETTTRGAVLGRVIAMLIVASAAIAAVLLPYWIALFAYRITQIPIPHASRANYILSPFWGLNYFVVPYGAMILALPFIILRGARVRRLRPLLIGFWFCFMIGLGGTTPMGEWILQRAFDVLTMERFSYWATLMALPIVGLLCSELVGRFRMRAAVPLGLLAAFTCAGAVAWSTFRPTDNYPFSVEPVAQWLDRGGHDQYRYIALGFGNKLSRLTMETKATTVDGEWYSARRLPELTKYGGGSLDNSKYFGSGGLEALQAILRHADRYGLKWIFVRDPYYYPLLDFAGYRQVDQLDFGRVTVWSKEGVPPAHPMVFGIKPPTWQGILWGTLPVGSSILALLLMLVPDQRRRQFEDGTTDEEDSTVVAERMAS